MISFVPQPSIMILALVSCFFGSYKRILFFLPHLLAVRIPSTENELKSLLVTQGFNFVLFLVNFLSKELVTSVVADEFLCYSVSLEYGFLFIHYFILSYNH